MWFCQGSSVNEHAMEVSAVVFTTFVVVNPIRSIPSTVLFTAFERSTKDMRSACRAPRKNHMRACQLRRFLNAVGIVFDDESGNGSMPSLELRVRVL